MKNFFSECYKFNMRCMHPAVVPIQYAVLYMIQSSSYILSPDFISNYKKIDLNEARVLWEMTHTPGTVCIEDIMTLLFNPLSYGKKVIFSLLTVFMFTSAKVWCYIPCFLSSLALS